MGKKCSLKNCKNYYHETSTFTFHELPRNELDKKRWLDAIPKDFIRENVKNITICSAHFSADNYQPPVLGLTKKMLRKTATPNLFNSHETINDSEKENNGQVNKPTRTAILLTPCSSENKMTIPLQQNLDTVSCSSGNSTMQSNEQNRITTSSLPVNQAPLPLKHNQLPTCTLLLITPISSENKTTTPLKQNLQTVSLSTGNSTMQSNKQVVSCLPANQTLLLLKPNQMEVKKKTVDAQVQTTCRSGKRWNSCVREEELLKKIRALQSRLNRRDAKIKSMKRLMGHSITRGSYKKGNIVKNEQDESTSDSLESSDEDDENDNLSLASNIISQRHMIWAKCGTCSKESNPKTSSNITKKFLLGKSFKDVILLFVPQMATTVGVDVICFNCSEILKSFANLIIRCIAVDEVLKRANKQNKEILRGNRRITNNFHTKNKSNVNSINRDKAKLQVRQDLKEPCQPKFEPIETISIHSDTDESDNQSVIEEIILQFTDTEEPEPPVEPVSNINGFKETYPNQKFTTNCENDSAVELFDLKSHKEEIWVEQAQSPTDEKKYNSCDILLPTDCIDEPTEMKKCKNTAPKEEETVPCTIDITDNTSTDNSDIINLDICEEIEVIAEEDNKTCDSIEEGFVDFYAKENHDKVISATENNELKNHSLPKTKTEISSICPVCKINVFSTGLLQKHLFRVHKDYKPYKCEKCGGSYRTKLSRDRHIQRYQNFERCDMRKCHICSELINWKSYHSHSKTHLKTFVCNECGEAFLSAHHLRYHSVKHKYKKETQQLCPICGKMNKNLHVHLLTHETGPKKYMCHKCPKFFMTTSQLNIHISQVHHETNLQCRECKMMFVTVSGLREHYRLQHSNIFPHACDICGKTFSRLAYLRKHVTVHLVDKKNTRRKYCFTSDKPSGPVKCKYCSKQFKTLHLLRIHLLTHVKKIRYKCNFCTLTFGTRSNKYRHEKRHKNPFYELSCEVCFQQMKTKEDFDKHMLKHENTKNYICQYCGTPFARQYLLTHHISEYHIDKEDVEKEKKAVLAEALQEFLL